MFGKVGGSVVDVPRLPRALKIISNVFFWFNLRLSDAHWLMLLNQIDRTMRSLQELLNNASKLNLLVNVNRQLDNWLVNRKNEKLALKHIPSLIFYSIQDGLDCTICYFPPVD